MHKFTALLLAILIASPALVAAETYSLVDARYLPLKNVYDPIERENEPIARYSFERLDALMWESPSFLRANDGKKICESMRLMFGRTSSRCEHLPVRQPTRVTYDTYVAPMISGHAIVATEARVTLNVRPKYHLPRPKESTPRSGYVFVDPVYPPYGAVQIWA